MNDRKFLLDLIKRLNLMLIVFGEVHDNIEMEKLSIEERMSFLVLWTSFRQIRDIAEEYVEDNPYE